MQLTRLTRHASHVIPVTSNTPNHHTGTTIQAADAYSDHDRSIATRISLNTGSARTRHSAATRMANDSQMTLPDVQAVLRHASIDTTGRYLTVRVEDIYDKLQEHYARRRPQRTYAAGYTEADIKAVFGD